MRVNREGEGREEGRMEEEEVEEGGRHSSDAEYC